MTKSLAAIALMLTLSLGVFAQAKDCCNGSSCCSDKACCKSHKK